MDGRLLTYAPILPCPPLPLATWLRLFVICQYGMSSPEIVAATTAHAAIEKACNLMGIRLVKVWTRAVENRTGYLVAYIVVW